MKVLPEQSGGVRVLDFYELNDFSVVIDRSTDFGWMWSRGKWQNDSGLAEKCYNQGQPLSQENFVRRFPYAALALLEEPEGGTPEN